VKALKPTQKVSKKHLAIIIISVVAVLALGYFCYAYATKNAWPFKAQATDTTTRSEDGINYNPPTEQEVENSQEAKENNAQRSENGTENGEQSNTSKAPVSVGIAYASYDKAKGAVDIRAFTPDVIEGTGICTATLTLNEITVIGKSKAFIDSSSSQCEPILIKRTDFPTTGKWSLVVSYDSPTSSGKSPAMEVEITNE
jgi:hypothetical protein